MTEEIKRSIIQQIDEIPPAFKYSIAITMLSAIYEKLPEWEEQQQEVYRQTLENILDFIENLKVGDE